MLYESPYCEKMSPKSKKVRQVVTHKSLFEILLRYIYNKKQIVYTEENILDIITEGYRYSLDDLVNQLWSTFNQTASAIMAIDGLKKLENRIEFSKRWGLTQLQTAIERNALGVLEMVTELNEPRSIQFVVSCAKNQNPFTIRQALLRWDTNRQTQGHNSNHRFVVQMTQEFLGSQKNYPVITKDRMNMQLFSAANFSNDCRRSKTETSYQVKVPFVVGASKSFHTNRVKIQSISPLVIEFKLSCLWNLNLVVRLWDRTQSFYIAKWCQGESPFRIEFEIKNTQEWAMNNALAIEVLGSSKELIKETTAKAQIMPLPPFIYPTNRARLSDFVVECHNDYGPVTYRLHKFVLQQSPHFQRIFSLSNFIESKTNKVTLETHKHLFEVVLRYLYNQDPLKDIVPFITDILLEASYYELTDFEKELWSLFEKEADATNCIKAINLMHSNMLFESCQANVLRVVARHIKGVLNEISKVLQWSSVQLILNQPIIKLQNPILVLESVAKWCQAYEKSQDCVNRVSEIFHQIFQPILCSTMVAKELKAKFPFLPEIKCKEDPFDLLDMQSVTEGLQIEWYSYCTLHKLKVSDQSEISLSVNNVDKKQLRLYDQLSHHYVVILNETKLNQWIENHKEWQYGGYYRVGLAGYQKDL